MKRQVGVFVAVLALLVGAMSCGAYAKAGHRDKMDDEEKGEMKCGQMGGGMGMMGDMDMMEGEGMMEGSEMMEGMHMGMMLKDPGMQKKLGLSEDQRAKLKDIFSDEKKKSIKSEADIKVLMLDLKDLMGASTPDNAKIDSKIDEIAAACADLAKTKIHAMQDAKSVLTPEQMDKCMEMKEKMEGGKDMKGMNKKKEKKSGKNKGKGMKEEKDENEENEGAWEMN